MIRRTQEQIRQQLLLDGAKERKLKEKPCRYCKKPFKPVRPLQVVCGYMCGMKLENAKIAKKEGKEWNLRKRELKEKTKTLSDYEAEAKKIFQRWIRKRDEDLPCISCGLFSARYDAGHYFDAGVYSGLIFNEDNCHKQCSNFCNRLNHGNKANYRIGLIKKIGKERVEWLEEQRNILRNKKYTREELIEIKNIYSQRLKRNN